MKTPDSGTDLYFEPFLGKLNLFLITEEGGIRLLDTYFDTPENRATLASVYGAIEVTGYNPKSK